MELSNILTRLNPVPENIGLLRNTLRKKDSEDLRRRRRIITLAAIGVIDFTVISLYQTGVIKRLPDLPLPYFDSNSVNASAKAFATGFPDGTSGVLMFGSTMLLASYGGNRQSGRKKYWDKLLMGMVSAGAIAGAQYLYDMAFKQKKICLYCVTGAALSFSMLPPAFTTIKESDESKKKLLH